MKKYIFLFCLLSTTTSLWMNPPEGYEDHGVSGRGFALDRSREDTFSEGEEVSRRSKGLKFKAVYDGHGGKRAAEIARDEFEEFLLQEEGFRSGASNENMYRAIKNATANLDRRICEACPSGTTAAGVVLDEIREEGHAFQVGDSRVLFCDRNGNAIQPIRNHTPQSERHEIERRGGYIQRGRIFGGLAVGRSVGDRVYGAMGHKKHTPGDRTTCIQRQFRHGIKTKANEHRDPGDQMTEEMYCQDLDILLKELNETKVISAVPDIVTVDKKKALFWIVTSDGLDVIGIQPIVNIVLKHLRETPAEVDLEDIFNNACKEMIKTARLLESKRLHRLYKDGDDKTVIIDTLFDAAALRGLIDYDGPVAHSDTSSVYDEDSGPGYWQQLRRNPVLTHPLTIFSEGVSLGALITYIREHPEKVMGLLARLREAYEIAAN